MELLYTSQIHSPCRFDVRVLQAVAGHRREGVVAAQLGDGLNPLVGLSNNLPRVVFYHLNELLQHDLAGLRGVGPEGAGLGYVTLFPLDRTAMVLCDAGHD